MAMDYATSYAEIVKYDKNDDGTLMVFGKATDDTLDLDSQICDPKWLDEAMPQWFKSGGNIREMHGPSAAGVAKEYEAKNDGHYISVHVVDPLAAKKVETGVYQGFSIGIKSPRVIRDTKAANGRIVAGNIIEISLVDRPANPSSKLILAKSVEGESTLVQVEEVIEKYNENHDEQGRFTSGDGDSSSSGGNSGGESGGSSHQETLSTARDAVANAKETARQVTVVDRALVEHHANEAGRAVANASDAFARGDRGEALSSLREAQNHLTGAAEAARQSDASLSDELLSHADSIYEAIGDFIKANPTGKTVTTDKEKKMETIKQITELAKSLTTIDVAKFDKSLFDNARRALAELIASEAAEMNEGHDERHSLESLINAVHALMDWYEGEEHEGEVTEVVEELVADKAADDSDADGENEADEEKSAKACTDGKCGKCMECMSEKDADTVREQEVGEAAIKSADAEEAAIEATEEVAKEDSATEEVAVDTSIEDVVEKAVKSAMESVKAEIEILRADKEAAVAKTISLESELATALSKAVSGGPKRTASQTVAVSNEYLVKAITYKAKADATTDPVLAKGYRDLHDEFLAKANSNKENK